MYQSPTRDVCRLCLALELNFTEACFLEFTVPKTIFQKKKKSLLCLKRFLRKNSKVEESVYIPAEDSKKHN